MSETDKKPFPIFGCVIIPLIPLVFVTVAFYGIFGEIRENAHTTSCQGNLRQLSTAFLQYSQDNDGAMPNVTYASGNQTWRDATLPYSKLKETYHCPNRRDDVGAGGFPQNYAANYSGNNGASQPDKGKGALAGPGSLPISRKDYPNPSQFILLLEDEHNPRPEFNIDNAPLFGPQTHKIWFGHFRMHGEFLMADGHVKSLVPEATYRYDPKNHTLFNFWYRNTDTRLSANGEAVLKDAEARFK